MHLKLDELQKLVKAALTEEKAGDALRQEIARVLGPVIVTERRFVDVVAAANDRLDVLDRTGRSTGLSWDSKVTTSWINHSDPEVRKFAARVVPESTLSKMVGDKNSSVRAAIANRSKLSVIKEMIKRFPADDQLRSIFRIKKLDEAGIKQPKIQDEPFDVNGDRRLGDMARTQQGPELSDTWYRTQARRFVTDYGRNIEYAWEEAAVNRFCSSVKAISGVDVDESKMLQCIKDLIEEKEDRALERDAVKETLNYLGNMQEQELMIEGCLPEFNDDRDPIQDLLESGCTGEQFIDQASQMFQIKESMLPLAIRKYRFSEGSARQTLVPCIGTLPHNEGFRSIDERALDMFCEFWSKRQAMAGEPLRLEWTTHPSGASKIGFTCVLK